MGNWVKKEGNLGRKGFLTFIWERGGETLFLIFSLGRVLNFKNSLPIPFPKGWLEPPRKGSIWGLPLGKEHTNFNFFLLYFLPKVWGKATKGKKPQKRGVGQTQLPFLGFGDYSSPWWGAPKIGLYWELGVFLDIPKGRGLDYP